MKNVNLLQRELTFWAPGKEKSSAKNPFPKSYLIFKSYARANRSEELIIANKKLLFQNDEKKKRAAELAIANYELAFQNHEKEKRAEELIIANKELSFQNSEKEKRASELVVANDELGFQNGEKEKRANELIIANKELAFQNAEKEKRANELIVANQELAFQNGEKEKRAAELIIANKELAFQNLEKERRAAELIVANEELAFQNSEKEKRAAELIVAKEKQAIELLFANIELKKAEKNIEFDRNNIKSLINNTHDLMWSVDRNYKFITSNHAFDEIVKRTSGRVVTKGGNALLAGFTEEKLEKYLTYYERAFAGETFTEIEFTSTPNEFWSEISFYPIKNVDKIIGTACFSRNITLRKKEENHLKLLESVITNTADSVLILDALPKDKGGVRIMFVNDAFTNMTGYSKEEVMDKSPYFLLGPNSDLSKVNDLKECVKNHEACEIEIIQYNKDGTEIWVSLEVASVINNRGVTTHFIAIERNVTERLKNLQAIKDQNTKLREIAKMQSHDVRGPLARIMGLVNLLANHFNVDDKDDVLSKLTTCSNELDEVITRIVRKAEEAEYSK